MSSTAFEQAAAAYNGVDAALDKLGALDCGALANQERLALLQRGESWRRRLPAIEHQLVSELAHARAGSWVGGRRTCWPIGCGSIGGMRPGGSSRPPTLGHARR